MIDRLKYKEYVEGAILGSVVGDALGVPGEFMTREELRENPITKMIGGGAHGQLPGTWSDDTSMTLCTIDSIIEKGLDYDDQMYRFADWLWNATNTARDEVFDVGGTTKHAIFRFMKKTAVCPPTKTWKKSFLRLTKLISPVFLKKTPLPIMFYPII